jgi:hypothetical protein
MSADMSRQHTLENTSVTGLFRSPMNYGEQRVGGWGGIRTHEGLLTLTPLAGERLQPLGHLSADVYMVVSLGFQDIFLIILEGL